MDTLAPEVVNRDKPHILSRFTSPGTQTQPQTQQPSTQTQPSTQAQQTAAPVVPKARGRPRIHPMSTEPKKPVGRPRTRTPEEQREHRKQYLRDYKQRKRSEAKNTKPN
jgi:hypothetical protein